MSRQRVLAVLLPLFGSTVFLAAAVLGGDFGFILNFLHVSYQTAVTIAYEVAKQNWPWIALFFPSLVPFESFLSWLINTLGLSAAVTW